jgi:putative ABC transport system permease protein
VTALLESSAQDLRFAARALGRTRGVTATAVLTLALGVAATAVMFSVVYGLLIAPLPYRDIDRSVVVTLRGVTDVGGWKGRTSFSSAEFEAFRAGSQVFEDVMGSGGNATVLYEDRGSTRVFRGARVTSNAFDYLGVPPLLGRSFTDADGQPGAAAVFAINYRAWRSEFGGDPAIVGRTFRLDGSVATLVAVMPARFQISGVDLWMPMRGTDWGAGLALMGRLKPGISASAAAGDLDAIAQRFAAANPGGNFPDRFVTVVRPYVDLVVGDFRNTVFGLLAAVLLLLGIACSNVANLLLARAAGRDREVAVRAALGASRSRLLRQLLMECLVIATAAAAAGVALAWLGLRLVVALMPAGAIPAETVIEMNAPVLGLSMVIAVATAVLCGLAPALHLVDAELQSRTAAASRSTGAPRMGRIRSVLVVSEVALCVVLLTGAGHLLKGYLQLTRVDLGFDPRNVLFVRPWLPAEYDSAEKKNVFTRQLLERLTALPGVLSAAESMLVPPLTYDWTDTIIPGKPHVERWETRFEVCSETYFELLGLRPVRGTIFTEADVLARRLVTVVNQAFADQYFAGENPIGQRVRFQVLDRPFLDAPHNVYFEIVGVVTNHKTWGGEWQTVPQAFIPYSVQGFSWRTFLARTSVDPDSLQRTVRDTIWAIDPRVGVRDAGSIEGSLRDFYRDPRFDLVTLGAFAAIGLGLVAAGVFGVMAYIVSARTREIGIRVAVGALGRQIALMVVTSGAKLIAAGYVAGALAAYWLSRAAAGWIPGIPTADPPMLGAVGGVIAVVGLCACLLPAVQAARVDPVVALRVE